MLFYMDGFLHFYIFVLLSFSSLGWLFVSSLNSSNSFMKVVTVLLTFCVLCSSR